MKQDKRGYRHIQMPGRNANRGAFLLLLLLCAGGYFFASAQTEKKQKGPAPDDEAAIRALESRFAAAFNAGDIDGIMKNYIPDKSLIIFDVVPRQEYRGADTYRRNWEDFFSHFQGTPRITITDLGITVDGNLGFSHSIQHVRGTDTQGHPVDRTVRVTDGYRKIGGNWLIVLEHVSVPVDLKTYKPASD